MGVYVVDEQEGCLNVAEAEPSMGDDPTAVRDLPFDRINHG